MRASVCMCGTRICSVLYEALVIPDRKHVLAALWTSAIESTQSHEELQLCLEIHRPY